MPDSLVINPIGLDNGLQAGIGSLPDGWTVASIGDLFEVKQGAAMSAKRRRGEDPHPFLRTLNVQWGRIDLSTLDQMDFTAAETSRLALKRGDLLVCEGGDIGRTAIWQGELDGCFYQNHLHRLRQRCDDIEPEFFMYWMQAAIRLLGLYGGHGNKTTIPNLSRSRLMAFAVPVPPFPEQRAIAAVLRTIQQAEDAAKAVVVATRELRTSLMRHLFTYGSVAVGDAGQVLLKETEVGLVPEHWTALRFEAVVNEITSGDWGDEQPSAERVPCRVVRGTDFRRVRLGQYESVPIRHLKAKSVSVRGVKSGDILVELSGGSNDQPTGRAMLVSRRATDASDLPLAFSNFVKRLRTSDVCDPEFVAAYWDYRYRQGATRIYEKRTTGIRNFKLGDFLRDEYIAVPPLEEQQQIVRALSVIDAKEEAEANRLMTLESMFRSMMHHLMTGKIRVGDLAMIGAG